MSRRTDPTRAEHEACIARDGGRCFRCGRIIPIPHLHHRKLRSRGGDQSPSNLIALCPGCHRWVHREVQAATADGLIVASWAHPADVPLRGWRGLALLDDAWSPPRILPL